MPSSGAPKGKRNQGATLSRHSAEHRGQHILQVGKNGLGNFILPEISINLSVPPGFIPQIIDPVWIIGKPHIENDIRPFGQPVAIGKTHNTYGSEALVIDTKAIE